MLREDVIKEIEEKKIMVVVRNIYDDELIRLADALAKGGVKCFEITYDQTDPDIDAGTGRQCQEGRCQIYRIAEF